MAQHGTGALNIDGCRIESADGKPAWSYPNGAGGHRFKFDPAKNGDGPKEAPALGRWPANVVLGCCGETPHRPDCAAALLDAQSGERGGGFGVRGGRGSTENYRMHHATGQAVGYGDSGGPSRFFLNVAHDRPCWLCGCEYLPKHGILSACPDAKNAAQSSSPADPATASVPGDAPHSAPPRNADRSGLCVTPAPTVARHSTATPATRSESGTSAPASVWESSADPIARHVASVADLCERCGTAIARSLAARQLGHDPALALGQASISEPRRRILIRSIALLAEGQANTATTPTIPALKMWCGYVRDAIANTTTPESAAANSASDLIRFGYHSKASRREREAGLEGMPRKFAATMGDGIGAREHSPNEPRAYVGNVHPTVKPLALMRWLCRLVTPPGGTILDPFAGSGSTGCAAVLEGFSFVGIEAEAEYVAISERRLAYWEKVARRYHRMLSHRAAHPVIPIQAKAADPEQHTLFDLGGA